MTRHQIIAIVESETGLTLAQMMETKTTEHLMARYAIIILLVEEGFSYDLIASAMGLHRTTVYQTQKTIDKLLKESFDFKHLYLACIARLTAMEDAA